MKERKTFRRSLTAVAMGVAATLLLAACGSPSSSGGTAPAPRSVSVGTMPTAHIVSHPAGVIQYSDWQFPDTLNPLQTTEASSFETINGFMATPLLYNNRAQLVPYLLTAVPSRKNGMIRDGGRLIIVKLRPGLRWSNGQPLTNQDLKFGWEMYMDPATGPACLGTCDKIASITLKGTYEADLHMRQVYAAVLANGLPTPFPHNWAALGTTPHRAAVTLATKTTFNYSNPSYVTSGPYQVSEFTRNNRIVLKPNPYYRGPGSAFAGNLIFAFYSSKESMISAAKNGQTNMTTDYTLADLKMLKGQSSTYAVHQTPSFTIEHLEFNLDPTFNGKPNPLHDVRVRQALALAVDRVGLIESAFGVSRKSAESVVAYSPLIVTPNFVQPYGDRRLKGQWDPIAGKYLSYGPQATADARKLLTRAGYPNGFNLEFVTTQGNAVRQAQYAVIEKNWADIGVRTQVDMPPPSAMFAGWGQNGPLNHGAFQVAMFAFLGGSDPDGLKVNLVSTYIDRRAKVHSAIDENYAGIKDPVIDAGFRTGAGTFDNAVRQAAYTRVQVEMNKMAYWVPLFSRPAIDTSDRTFTGFASNPTSLGPTWNVFAWRPVAR